MLRIGLTGGIGSGKTTVANIFAKYGINIIDADHIALQVSNDRQVHAEIIQYFGKEILNKEGVLDRAKLRQTIFQNTEHKLWLEQLLHPRIRQKMQEQIKLANPPYCILVIPLLTEAKKPIEFIDRICVVDCPESLQIARACERDQLSKQQVINILNQQSSRQRRLEFADDIIENDNGMDKLKKQVEVLHNYYLKLTK